MNASDTGAHDSVQKRLKHVKGLMLGRAFILTLLLSITLLFQISKREFFFIPLTMSIHGKSLPVL